MRLNKEQRTLTGEVLGNIAVASFASGVIIPSFARPIIPEQYLSSLLFGMSLFIAFYLLAIYMLKT